MLGVGPNYTRFGIQNLSAQLYCQSWLGDDLAKANRVLRKAENEKIAITFGYSGKI